MFNVILVDHLIQQWSKNNATRLFELTCKVCGAQRTVKSIQHGFKAATRDDRRVAKKNK